MTTTDEKILRANIKELLELRAQELAKRLNIDEQMAAHFIVVKIMLETEGLRNE